MGWMIVFYFVGALVIALLQWITGRIILPEMGLTAPDYGPWLAVALLVEMPFVIFNSILSSGNRSRW